MHLHNGLLLVEPEKHESCILRPDSVNNDVVYAKVIKAAMFYIDNGEIISVPWMVGNRVAFFGTHLGDEFEGGRLIHGRHIIASY